MATTTQQKKVTEQEMKNEALLQLISKFYPTIAEDLKRQAFYSQLAVENQKKYWKEKNIQYDDWVIPYFLQNPYVCTRHNHVLGYGCSETFCDREHRCMICRELDTHGAFFQVSDNWKCPVHKKLSVEMDRIQKEDWYSEEKQKQLIKFLRECNNGGETPNFFTRMGNMIELQKSSDVVRNSTVFRQKSEEFPPLSQTVSAKPRLSQLKQLDEVKKSTESSAQRPRNASGSSTTAKAEVEAEEIPVTVSEDGCDDNSVTEMKISSGITLRGTFGKDTLLGESDHAKVYHLQYSQLGVSKDVAVKMWNLPAREELQKKIVGDLNREVICLQALSSEHIVKMFFFHPKVKGTFGAEYALLVMEKCKKATLATYIVDSRNVIDTGTLQSFTLQLLQALEHCHQRNVLHRDLKPENVLIAEKGNSDGYPKLLLCDFAFSKKFEDGSSSKTRTAVGTVDAKNKRCWPAPEVGKEDYGRAADIWTMGSVIYFMTTGGNALFRTESERDADDHDQLYKRHGLDQSYPLFFDLVLRMTKREPGERGSANEALSHPALWKSHQVSSNIGRTQQLLKLADLKDAELREYAKSFRQKFQRNPAMEGNWWEPMDDTLKALILRRRTDELKRQATAADVQKKDDWCELVRWLRNVQMHCFGDFLKGRLPTAVDENSKTAMLSAESKEAYADIVVKTCPKLLIGLYDVLKSFGSFEVDGCFKLKGHEKLLDF